MKFELLIDSVDFWARFKNDIASAQKNIYIQTLSFEGDSVGKKLAAAMTASKAVDKRIIVDNYTRYILSDKFLYSPRNWFDRELQNENRETIKMMADLNSNGTAVKFVNPVGLFMVKLPSRNHKKIIVIDDRISYIGGINFNDHNFLWHDLMLRIEEDGSGDNEGPASFLKNDFLISWEDNHFGGQKKFGRMELISLDGKTNPQRFAPIFDLIDGAQKSIYVQSPYLSSPFTERLHSAAGRAKVTIVTPEKNNKKQMGEFIRWQANRSRFNLRLYPERMTHLKAMLIDEKYLILGSSNFDYFSYHFEQETIAILTDQKLISDFIEKVIIPDNDCSPSSNGSGARWGAFRNWQIRTIGKISKLFN